MFEPDIELLVEGCLQVDASEVYKMMSLTSKSHRDWSGTVKVSHVELNLFCIFLLCRNNLFGQSVKIHLIVCALNTKELQKSVMKVFLFSVFCYFICDFAVGVNRRK